MDFGTDPADRILDSRRS